MDIKTSDNKIGDIINLSQELNTILWDRMNNGAKYEDIKELYYDICQLDVMSNIEIDKAKREYTTDTYREMQKIKTKWVERDPDGKMIKPNFFGHIARTKGYYDSKKKSYLRHDTSMDCLQKVINQYQLSAKGDNTKKQFLSIGNILQTDDCDLRHGVKHEQAQRVIDLFIDYTGQQKAIYMDENLDKDTKYKLAAAIRQECIEYIGNIHFSKSTMIYLLNLLDNPEYKHIGRNMINILFGYPNSSFFTVLKESKTHIPVLTECQNGDIKIFDYRFKKVIVE